MGRSMAVSVAVGLMTAAVLLGGCAPSAGEETVYHASYPTYASAGDLAEAASLIVVGTVISSEVREIDVAVQPADPDNPDLNPELGSSDAGTDGLFVFTVYQVRVDEVLEGEASAGDVIEVSQLGGEFRGRSYREEGGSPSLKARRSYALYLSTYDNGLPASLLNPSQASYEKSGERGFESLDSRNPIAAAVVEDIQSRRGR